MRDQRAFPDRREHVPLNELHIEHGNAGATAIELHQARLGAVRIEAGLRPTGAEPSWGGRAQ
jgi:hypothetical protein